MNNTVLVTDSLFIADEHVAQIEAAGFKVERLDKMDASEAELCQALKGKIGYILGGMEQVTEKVIDAADSLKVIALTGVGFEHFVPAWQYAAQKGIAVTNTPGGPTNEVAEWALTAALVMNRRFLELGLAGTGGFQVTAGLEDQRVGIIGMGRIGQRITDMTAVFRPRSISYYSTHRHQDVEQTWDARYLELPALLEQSDVVFLCAPDRAKGFIGKSELGHMPQGSLLVNITHPGIIDEPALFAELKSGRLRAISDYPMRGFAALPAANWYSMQTSNTVTKAGAKLMSDMATASLLNVLQTGTDQYRVN